ncbi:MAG: hypothetical protein FD123_1802 [Bacteroidetes bacterium]|nr:MAG: hypothetical protein FD123_1802 [Bacteroidota bacterium]
MLKFVRMTSRIITLFAFLFLSSAASAQIGGSVAFASLDLPLSARIASMGGKVVSVNDNDINMAFWNPALLNQHTSNQVALSFVDYLSDIKYGYAGYSYHVNPKVGTFAGFITHIDYGKFKETDNTGAVIGEFTASENVFNVGWSRAIDSLFTVGATMKYIGSNLYVYKANGVAFDFGVNFFKPSKNFSASVVLRNAGMMLRNYSSGREKLPFELEAGASYKPKHMPFRFTLTLQQLQQWDLTFTDPANPPQLVDPLTGDSIKTSKFRTFGDKLMRHAVLGGELLLGKSFHIRFGYNYMRRKELLIDTRPGMLGFSFGAGVRIYKFHLSYARSSYHMAGGTNTFTLSSNISDFYKKK